MVFSVLAVSLPVVESLANDENDPSEMRDNSSTGITMLACLASVFVVSHSRAEDDFPEMLDVSLSCPATQAAGTLALTQSNRRLTRVMVVRYADYGPQNVKLYVEWFGRDRVLLNDIDVAKTYKTTAEELIFRDMSMLANALKTRKGVPRRSDNTSQRSNGTKCNWRLPESNRPMISGTWPPNEEYKVGYDYRVFRATASQP